MSNNRNVVTDLPKEIQKMLGDNECVYYKGQSKRCAPGGELVNPTVCVGGSGRKSKYMEWRY